MGKHRQGLLSRPQFRWFFWGRTISLFGSAMTPISLAFAVLQASGGQHLLGYILAAEILPNVLMLLIGGTLADRYRRDILLIGSNLGSGISQAAIAAIVLFCGNPVLLFPFAIANGVLGAFTTPAMRGIIPELVDRDDIKKANSLLNVVRSTTKIIGPAGAGILVATIGGGFGIAADAVTFFVATLCFARVRIAAHPATSQRSLFRDMNDGWAYFRNERWIWCITLAFAFMNCIQMGVWQVLGPIIAKHTFGSTGWGLTLSAKSVGLLIASFFMLKLQLRQPLRSCVLAVSVSGIPMILLGADSRLPYLITVAMLAGAGSAISSIVWDTSLQQAVPKDKLSRVCAFDDFGSYVTIPAGEILAVPLAGLFGYQPIALVGGVLFIIFALLPLLVPSVGRSTHHPSNPV